MKILYWNRNKKTAVMFAAAAALLLAAVLFFYIPPKEVIHAWNGTAGKFEIQSELFKDAVKSLGVCSPQESAAVWAEGIKQRNGAMQYAVMTEALQSVYAHALDKRFPNWVTGVSSPWVASYTIREIHSSNKKRRVFSVLISTATSTGPAGVYRADLTIIPEDKFWRIEKIQAGPELIPFTGFKP